MTVVGGSMVKALARITELTKRKDKIANDLQEVQKPVAQAETQQNRELPKGSTRSFSG